MKRQATLLAALVLTIAAGAQTLNVKVGDVTYQFPASQAGEMTYADGTTLTIMGKTFTLSDISQMNVDESEVTDNLVSIAYSTSGDATVSVPGNVAQYVSATVSGNHVTIDQTNTDAVDGDEITYQLSGTATDGSFTLGGSYKCTVSLAGVNLTNPSGAAINITNSKRIQLSAKKDTDNTLADGSGSQKACIYSKGQLQLQGNGTLNVAGNLKHGIKSASYIAIKNLTLNITSAVGDGINCEEYLQMKSGTVTISGVGDDGIQCDLDGTSTGETTDHEDEDSGNIYLEGGTLNCSITAAAAKGIKAAGDLRISGGEYNVSTSGKYAYDDDDQEYKSSVAMKTDANMVVSGGTLTLQASGYSGKCIKVDGTMDVTGGSITAASKGSSSTTYGSAKAIKVVGAMTVSGGSITASSSSHEGIESKSTLTFSGGYTYSTAKDDAINSASHMYVKDGAYVFANSTGNDGMDANGNLYIEGGNVLAVAATSPEVALDANTESRYQLYITGGNVVAIGGLESGASVSNGTAYQASSYSKGAWYALYNSSSSVAFAFKVPSNSSMGTPMVVYTTGSTSLMSGVTGSGTSFWDGNGYTSCSGGSSVSLSTYSGGNGGGGFGPGGGNKPGGGGFGR